MKVTVICPGCTKTYELPQSHLGKRARCKKCATEFVATISISEPPPALPEPVVRIPLQPAIEEPKVTLNVECPSCRCRYNLDRTLVGKRVRCKGCGEVFRVSGDAPQVVPPCIPEPLSPTIDALMGDDEEFDFAPIAPRPSARRSVEAGAIPGETRGKTAAEIQPGARKGIPWQAYVVGIVAGILAFWLTWTLVMAWLKPSQPVSDPQLPAQVTQQAPAVDDFQARTSTMNELIETHEKILAELAGIKDAASREAALVAITRLEKQRDVVADRLTHFTPLAPKSEGGRVKQDAEKLARFLEHEREQLKRICGLFADDKGLEIQIRYLNQAISELYLASHHEDH